MFDGRVKVQVLELPKRSVVLEMVIEHGLVNVSVLLEFYLEMVMEVLEVGW